MQIIPETLKFAQELRFGALTQYYEKNSGLSALFQYAPIYAHVNADYVILFKKTQARELTPVQIIPETLKFCTRTQVWWLTQYYEKNSGLSALFQYAPIYAHVNADYVILFKKTQARE